jgi:hypothetical protein
MFQRQQPKKRYSKATLPINRTTHGATICSPLGSLSNNTPTTKQPSKKHPPLASPPTDGPSTHADSRIAAVKSIYESCNGIDAVNAALEEAKDVLNDPNSSKTKQKNMAKNIEKIQLLLGQVSPKLKSAANHLAPMANMDRALKRTCTLPLNIGSPEPKSPMESVAAMVAPSNKGLASKEESTILWKENVNHTA